MSWVAATLLGVFAWSLTEYCLHRGLGHRSRPKNPFSVEHLKHHATLTWFAPTWKKALAAGVVLGTTGWPLRALFGAPGLAGAAAFAATYVAYEVLHRRLHDAPGAGRYGRWARRHHLHHHYLRPRKNHGVTSPLWDWVFGTLEVPATVQVPAGNALPWMLDADGKLRTELATDYVLLPSKTRASAAESAAAASAG